ncbi:MAG TPA: Crp/Fnr family transcriptional regulator [Firmicutes bacterium]|nr:Crp/Fnr family transcriptional regulator [Bacillota bacterium]
MGDLACIRSLDLFSDLTDAQFAQVISCIENRSYSKEEFLFHEGDRASRIFVLKSGRIKLFKNSWDGKELILAFLTPDSIFGEDAVFSGETYSASAMAVEDSCALVFTRSNIERILLENPGIAVKVIENLSRRLYKSTNQVSDIAFRDARGRLASALLRLSSEYGKPSREGTVIDLNLTHQDIANIVSLSRTTVTNLLLDLRDNELITIKNHRIILKDQARLADWVR